LRPCLRVHRNCAVDGEYVKPRFRIGGVAILQKAHNEAALKRRLRRSSGPGCRASSPCRRGWLVGPAMGVAGHWRALVSQVPWQRPA